MNLAVTDKDLVPLLDQLTNELGGSKFEKKQPRLVEALRQSRDKVLKALDWETQVQQAQESLEDARSLTNQLNERMEEFQQETDQGRKRRQEEHEQALTRLEGRLEFVQAQEKKLSETLSRLQDITRREKECAEAEKRLEGRENALQAEQETLRELVERNTTTNEKLSATTAEIATSLDGFAEIRAQINKREEDLNRRETILNQWKAELDEREEQTLSTEMAMEKLAGEREALQKELQELRERKAEEFIHRERDLEAKTHALMEKEAELAALSFTIAERGVRYGELKADLDAKESKLADRETQVDNLLAELTQREEQVAELEGNIARLRQREKELNEKLATLRKQL